MKVAMNDWSQKMPYLERGASFGIQVGDVSFLRVSITSKRGRVVNFTPLGTTNELGGGVQLGSEVKYVHFVVGRDHERVDLQVGEEQLGVNAVQVDDELGSGPDDKKRSCKG
jgi:hypothetical protein